MWRSLLRFVCEGLILSVALAPAKFVELDRRRYYAGATTWVGAGGAMCIRWTGMFVTEDTVRPMSFKNVNERLSDHRRLRQ